MFEVRFSAAAREDLGRLLDFLLDSAETVEDRHNAGRSTTRRELIIPVGATGYVALHEIVSPALLLALAVRHRREEDHH